MLSVEQFGGSAGIATMVVPVAVYFLILGLLNSRRHPQLLTSRRDFAMLLAALSPLFVLPAVGHSPTTLLAVAATLAGAIVLLAPRGKSWVIYNMPPAQARNCIARSLRAIGLQPKSRPDGFDIEHDSAFVRISGFWLVRNVSVRLVGGSEELAGRFQASLAKTLSQVRAETTPMAVSLLLVATAMMVAPLALMAHRVPEIVRLLTDLLYY
ncbi:MAG: hypothetical protein SVT52_07995 [Planctomycetota bacterium]|nr:hypothetical protein [Planctomycetota bacterium]